MLRLSQFFIYWTTFRDNRSLEGMKVHFDRAIIILPNGDVVEGPVTSWQDYCDSDVVQITIGGKTYMTHYMNVCLIND